MPHTEEPCGKKSSMGSENRQSVEELQGSFRGNLKSSVTRSIAPKRVALENRRYLPERLLFPHSSMQSQTEARGQREAQKGYEYSTSSATYAVKPGGN